MRLLQTIATFFRRLVYGPTMVERMRGYFEERLKWFSDDPRRRCRVYDTWAGELCKYSPVPLGLLGVSQGCWIGMDMTPDNALTADSHICSISSLMAHYPELLPEWLREFPLGFLKDCQYLHDVGSNWTDEGLSGAGEEEVDAIRSKWLVEGAV